jgi:hypothetical protein
VAREIILLTVKYLLPNEKFDCPEVLWFSKLRESLGVEAELYTYMEVAAAEKLLQMGFDETKINGQSTLNLWLLIQKKDNTTKVCYLECAGILIGGTADEVVTHIEKKFKEAASSLKQLKDLLTSQGLDADELVPEANGGLDITRVKSLMHDTCHTANATARKMIAGKSGVTQQLAYLKELLTLMIEYDIKHNHYSSPSSDTSGPSLSLYRTLPEPNPELCSSASLAYEKVGREAASKMDIEEDEEFNQFDKYVGKLFYDRDESKFFKVMAIEYDEKFGFLASSVNCDVHGDVLAECMTPFGDVIDKHIWPYTLEGNAEGDTMDDLIRAYEEKAKQLSESQTQKKKSKRTRH